MAEREIVLERQKTSFEGLFSPKEVITVIKNFADDKSMDWEEAKHSESVTADGRFIDIELDLPRKINDYAKKRLKLKIQMSKLKEKIVDIDGKKKKYFEGKFDITTGAYIETDYEKRWESKPSFYLIRVFFEKYIFSPQMNKYKSEIKEDYDLLKQRLKTYFNMMQIK